MTIPEVNRFVAYLNRDHWAGAAEASPGRRPETPQEHRQLAALASRALHPDAHDLVSMITAQQRAAHGG